MVIGPSLYLHSFNKLEEDAYRGIVDCDFFKIFTKHEPEGLANFLGKREFTGKTINAGKKKPAGLYALPA